MSKKFFLRYHDHLPIGCSVHHPRGAVGSVTCFVRSPEERHHSLLTSGHVASSYGTTDADTLLKRPGSQGPDPLADFALVKQVILPSCGAPAGQFAPGAADMDAAVARLLGNVRDDLNRVPDRVNAAIAGTCDIDPNLLVGHQLNVTKFGAGSGETTGYVADLNQEVVFCGGDDDSLFYLEDQVAVRTPDGGNRFAVEGDSGAPVVLPGKDGQVMLTGQIVCGNAQGGRNGITYMTPIIHIMQRFGLTLVLPS